MHILSPTHTGVVGYNFQADKDFAARYHNLVFVLLSLRGPYIVLTPVFSVIAADRSKSSVILDGVLPYIPKPVMKILLNFPPPVLVKLLEFKSAIGTLAKTLIKDKMDALELGVEPEKDLISVLGSILSCIVMSTSNAMNQWVPTRNQRAR